MCYSLRCFLFVVSCFFTIGAFAVPNTNKDKLFDSTELILKKIYDTKKQVQLDSLWNLIGDDKNAVLRNAYTEQEAIFLSFEGKGRQAFALVKNIGDSSIRQLPFVYEMIVMVSGKDDLELVGEVIEKRKLLYMQEIVYLREKPKNIPVEKYINRLNNEKDRFDILLAVSYDSKGEYDKALYYVSKEIKKNRKIPAGNELYSKLLEQNGDSSVQLQLEGFVKDGAYTQSMVEQLKRISLAKNPNMDFDTYYEKLNAVNAEKEKKAVLAKMIDQPTPDIVLKDMDGRTVKLADYKGKVVVLDFWATWCMPCIASFPAMTKVRDTLTSKEKDVVFLFVHTFDNSPDEKSALKKVNDFLSGKPYKLDVLMDYKSNASKSFGISAIPTRIIVDPKGNTRYKSTGMETDYKKAYEEIQTVTKYIM